MENIIEELLRIEEQAGRYVEEAESRRRDVSAQARERIERLREELEAEADGKIRLLDGEAGERSRGALEALERGGGARMKRLEEDFAGNRAAWEEQITRRVLYGGR